MPTNVIVTEILLDGHTNTALQRPITLRVVIDAKLTLATHVKRVASRCLYQLRHLWCVRPALSVDNAKMLAHAFITSRVDYCNSILYHTAAVHLRPLQLVLNAAARLVVKKGNWDSITLTIRDNLHWLLVRQIKIKICILVHKCLHQLVAPYLVSMISPVSAVSTRRHLRSAGQGDLVWPRRRTTCFGPRSFSVAGPLAWSSLSPEIKTTSLTLEQLSGRLKT